MAIARIEINYETMNAAFDPDEETGCNASEVADVLTAVAQQIRSGDHRAVGRSRTSCTKIYDSMGNSIGTLAIVLRGKNK